MKVGRTVLAMLLLAVASLTLPQAAAAETDLLDVRIDHISSPAIDLAAPDQVIVLEGQLTNVSTQRVSYVNVHFWRLSEPITTQARLVELTAGGEVPLGGRLFDEAAGNLDSITGDGWLAPGERASFKVQASVAQLADPADDPLSRDDAAYLLGVQVRAIPESGGNRTVGRARVAVAATRRPVESSALVLLSAKPARLPDGTFVDDSLAVDLGDRLEALLAAAERDGVTTAVDPYLYDSVRGMSAPHVVAGSERPGSGVALRWVDRVDALARQGRLWLLPYGDPDLTRAHASGALAEALAARQGVDGLESLPSVAVVDAVDDALTAELADVGLVVARNASGVRFGSPPIVSSAPQPPLSAQPEGVRLASTIAAELLAPTPPLYLLDTAELAAADADGEQWRRHVAPGVAPGAPLRVAEAPSRQPWPTVTDALAKARGDAQFIASLTGATPAYDAARVTAVAFSAGFATEEEAAAYVVASSPTRVDETSLEFRAAGSFVMGARTSTFPVTVTNRLPADVIVGVTFTSNAPQRIRIPDLAPVTVPAGDSVTLNVQPEASANGIARIEAQLTTRDGEPLGQKVEIEVTATEFGRVGWIIIVVSGAVVVGGSALRIVAVRRERAKENSESSQ